MPHPKITDLKPMDEYKLRLKYETGEIKLFDVRPYIKGTWFGELLDKDYFNAVKLLPDGSGIEWSNGQDIAPHELYEQSSLISPGKNNPNHIYERHGRHDFSPVRKTYTPDEIKEIRINLCMTQRVFAGVLGVSQKTVEFWESGRYSPDGASRRLLSILQMDPELPERCRII